MKPSEPTRTIGRLFDPIPRTLHQTWKSADPPERWRAYRDSWTRAHPHWSFHLWTDADNRALIAERHPWFLPTYDDFPRAIQRVDAAKFFLLYTFGGVYADLDCECRRPLDPLLEEGGLLASRTPDGVIDCAFLASPPGHPFWEDVFAEMQRPPRLAAAMRWLPPLHASRVLFTTGPRMLRRAVARYRRRCRAGVVAAGLRVLPPRYVSSRSWLARYQEFTDPESYVHHHHSDSWLAPREAAIHRYLTTRNVRRALLVVAGGTLAVLLAGVLR